MRKKSHRMGRLGAKREVKRRRASQEAQNTVLIRAMKGWEEREVANASRESIGGGGGGASQGRSGAESILMTWGACHNACLANKTDVVQKNFVTL